MIGDLNGNELAVILSALQYYKENTLWIGKDDKEKMDNLINKVKECLWKI